jgi:murein hydrolase activator
MKTDLLRRALPLGLAMVATLGLVASATGEPTPTIFRALEQTEARGQRHRDAAQGLEKEVRLIGDQVALWSRDADMARRATAQLREKVAASITAWERAYRKADTHRHAWRPQIANDTAYLLAQAQLNALNQYENDFALLRSVHEGGDRIESMFVHQGRLIVELAQHRGQEASSAKEREVLLEQATSDAGQARIARDLDATQATLTTSMEQLPKNPTAEDFHRLKGTLISPVSGRPTHGFGPRKQDRSMSFVRHTGLTYATPMQTPVRAVGPGEVVFAGRMEGYGNIVIIDHGSGYHSLYAHLDTFEVSVGQRPGRGTGIGKTGDSGSLEGPKFYFELRHQGRPIDPGPWFLRS